MWVNSKYSDRSQAYAQKITYMSLKLKVQSTNTRTFFFQHKKSVLPSTFTYTDIVVNNSWRYFYFPLCLWYTYSSLILEYNTPAVVAFVGADDSVHHREHVPESETADWPRVCGDTGHTQCPLPDDPLLQVCTSQDTCLSLLPLNVSGISYPVYLYNNVHVCKKKWQEIHENQSMTSSKINRKFKIKIKIRLF